MRQILWSYLPFVLLVGCTSIPLTSIPKLAALKPETMELGQLELAVRVQEDFRLYKDGTKLEIILTPEEENAEIIELYLVPSDEPLTPYLLRQAGKRFQMIRFALNPEDVPRITAYREKALAIRTRLEADDRGGEGGFSIASSGCLAKGANPFQDLRMKFFIRTRPDEEFYPPLKEFKISLRETGDKTSYKVGYCVDDDVGRLID